MNSRAVMFALSCLGLAFIGGCAGGPGTGRPVSASPPPTGVTATPTPGNPDLISGSGTVRHLELEGGFFGIVADDEVRYDPGELDARFRRDGLRVRFDLRRHAARMSTRQWGTLVTVVRLDSL